jgi:hypothetical protein
VGHISEVFEIDNNLGVWTKDFTQISLSASIDIINAQNMITCLQEIEQSYMGRHARSTSERVICVLHCGQIALKSKASWVAASRIVKYNWLAWLGLRKSG